MTHDNQRTKLPDQINASLLKSFKNKVVVVKYGGNAMTDNSSQEMVMQQIAKIKELGIYVVIVHGGGPVIQSLFETSGLESEFIDGHRVTLKDSMKVVEQALSGTVNGLLVNKLNYLEANAVGLSGKDGKMVQARKRKHSIKTENRTEDIDLGFVGDVEKVDTTLLSLLLKNGYLPVISPVSSGDDGNDYNINADMFAGHLAGALHAKAFVAITNVDGLMENPDKPDTRIDSITANKARSLFGTIIMGGMIPKIEACLIALDKGVEASHIVNGSTPDSILSQLFTEKKSGTTIR